MNKKAWVVSINMGYGHQRTAYPLKSFAEEGKIICANDYPGIPEGDRKVWESSRYFYEFISRFKKFPLFGNIAFNLFDATQRIKDFYDSKDMSGSTFTQDRTVGLFKRGWGKDLIERLSKKSIPLVSTFHNPAFMAEHFKYPGDIYCVICDADISRSWAPPVGKDSRIKYFTPNVRTGQRLRLYGVKKQNIIMTGYPLPMENIGGKHMEVLLEDMKNRIINLDPSRKYREKHDFIIREKLGKLPEKSDHPLTIAFAVGGAGAQKEIGVELARRLKKSLYAGRLKIVLVAGTKKNIKEYFEKELRNGGMGDVLGSGIEIVYGNNFEEYYDKFNLALRNTDILWTKPSALSFYAALGLPIIIAPTIGSQEEYNKIWLLKSGFGVEQREIGQVKEWLYDWLNEGYFADMAMEGFISGEKMGTFKIKEQIQK
ncbi:MAG: hypothetical protein PHH21_01340 [Candidatus Pacebacteria bacterium]|nr:hypothetical protein [Candidatus Paceibacterota bacterium]